MIRAISIVLLLILSAPAYGQTVVQAQSNRSTSTNAVIVTISSTTGNALVAWSRQGNSPSSTVTMTDSSLSGTWVQSTSGYVSGNGTDNRHALWYKLNSAAVTAVTCTWGVGDSPTDMVVFEVSGLATSSGEDSSVNSSNSSTASLATGNLTTTNATDILLAGWGAGANETWGAVPSGYTFPTNGSTVRLYMAYQVVSSTQSAVSVTQTDSASSSMASVFLALKAASSGGGGGSSGCTLTVVGAGPC